MKKFKVTIVERLEKEVEVEAEEAWEAADIVEADWCEGKYVLDADCFVGAKFYPEEIKEGDVVDAI